MTGLIRKSVVFVAALALAGSAAGSMRAPASVGPRSPAAGLTLTNVRANGKTLVATGADGRLIVSENDGRTWNAVSSPVGANLRGVAYADGAWLAVGDLGAAAKSFDNGAHWTAVDLGSTGAFRAVAYSTSGFWVAGANEGTVLVSREGLAGWTPASLTTDVPFWGATGWRGMAILTGDNGEILTSPEGLNWTLRHAPVPFEPIRDSRAFLWQVVPGPQGLVAVGARGAVAFSPDGERWSAPKTPLTRTLRGVAHGRGRYVAVGEDGQIGTSRNGRKWKLVERVPTDEILRGVTFTGDAFVAVGDFGTALRSVNGLRWKIVLDGARRGLNSVAYRNGFFVAVGAGGRILRSPYGRPWRSYPSGTRRHLYGVGGGGGGFVAVGAGGTVLTSEDGRRWTARKSGTRQSLRTVSFVDGRWYAAGDGGVVLSSVNRRSWQRDSTLAPFSVRQLVSDGALQLAVGAGIVAARPPGGTWSLNPAGDYSFKTGVSYAQGQFVVSGHAGAILTSSDAANWTHVATGSVRNLEAVGFADGIWVTAGFGFLATSPDARTWTQRDVPASASIRSLAYGAGRWVAVGDQGVILTSADGINWTAG